jgi:hypothetical protein
VPAIFSLIEEAANTLWETAPRRALAEAYAREAARLCARGNPDPNSTVLTKEVSINFVKCLLLHPNRTDPEYVSVSTILRREGVQRYSRRKSP